MVYRCVYDSASNEVALKEIIYIGKTGDLNERLNGHDKSSMFQSACEVGEEICYAYATVSMDDLDVVENALIFAQKPKLNSELVNSYKYENGAFLVEGKCALLKYTNFTIG